VFPRGGVHGRIERAAGSRAWNLRPDLPRLQRRKADAPEAEAGLQTAARQVVLAPIVPRHAARSRDGAVLAPSPVDARRRHRRPARIRTYGNAPLRIRM